MPIPLRHAYVKGFSDVSTCIAIHIRGVQHVVLFESSIIAKYPLFLILGYTDCRSHFCGLFGIIPLRPGLGERRRLRRGSTRRGRAARIDAMRANSRKGRGPLAGYTQSPRGA